MLEAMYSYRSAGWLVAGAQGTNDTDMSRDQRHYRWHISALLMCSHHLPGSMAGPQSAHDGQGRAGSGQDTVCLEGRTRASHLQGDPVRGRRPAKELAEGGRSVRICTHTLVHYQGLSTIVSQSSRAPIVPPMPIPCLNGLEPGHAVRDNHVASTHDMVLLWYPYIHVVLTVWVSLEHAEGHATTCHGCIGSILQPHLLMALMHGGSVTDSLFHPSCHRGGVHACYSMCVQYVGFPRTCANVQ
jgi:hypothetical protein